jgi:hypothetical protein
LFLSFYSFAAALQPVTSSSNVHEQRARLVNNGSSSTPAPQPPTGSLQSLTTTNLSTGVHVPSTLVNRDSTTNNADDHDEKEKLQNDLEQMKIELQKSKDTIARLQKSEEQMRERYFFIR